MNPTLTIFQERNEIMLFGVEENQNDMYSNSTVTNKQLSDYPVLIVSKKKPIDKSSLMYCICEKYDIKPEDVKVGSRKAEYIPYRTMYCYYANIVLGINQVEIAEFLGYAAHDTVSHHVNKLRGQMAVDHKYPLKTMYLDFEKTLND